MATLIRNGTIVTAVERFKGDILIDGEKITAIGTGLEGRAEEIVDAEGKYILPGGIDGHTHFSLPFMGTSTAGFETTLAAIVGGTTTIVDFAPQPQGMFLLDSIAKHREEKAEGKSVVDFGFHAMVMDAHKGIFEEPPALVKAGITTIKLFMAYKGTPFYSDDATIFQMLQKTKEVGMLTMLHAENGDVIDILQKQLVAEGKTDPQYHAASRPTVVEAEATARATSLASAANAPVFVVHISCTEAMTAVRDARHRGITAFGETCPQYLVLAVDNLAKPNFEGAKYVCSPPLRDSWHHDRLWESIQQGWLQVVGSDHCGFNFKGQKEMGRGDFTKIPNGAPGVENRLAILYTYGVLTGKLSLERMVDVFATAPAKFYGLYPQKGSISVGADADIVILDPEYSGKISVETSLQGIDFNAYEGFEQRGRPDKVFLRGKLSVKDGKFVGELGQGKFLERQPYGLAYATLCRE
ncbi:MAG: dihydropyrimidinase [candidate division Zixibacteria bacterium]|nr:dihydropyrimidinase [candidate division Zixibacteria bacterium]